MPAVVAYCNKMIYAFIVFFSGMQQKNTHKAKKVTMLNDYPPFLLEKSGKPPFPLVLSSPHSGTFYPERLFQLTDLKLSDFQRYEDASVDRLFSFIPAMGLPLLSAVYGRAWVDLNRYPLELDPTMFSDSLPSQIMSDSARVKYGFGVIARQLNANKLIYREKLRFSVEQKRLTDIHFPYHAALKGMIERNLENYGKSLLLDLHSMPVLPSSFLVNDKMPDFVLGTANGEACAHEIAEHAAEILQDMGFFVTINLPYSGAYTTLNYGRPAIHSHAMQIEIGRHLYWNEEQYTPSENFNTLWRKLSVFIDRFLRILPTLKL